MTASLTEALQGLKISNNSPSSGTSSSDTTINDALKDFIDTIIAIFERIPANSDASSQAIDAGDVAFFRDAQHLVTKSKILADIAERSVIDSIIARGNPYGELPLIELLENFDTKTRAIGSEVAADQTISAAEVPWKIAEKCYMEAFQPSGRLHVAQCFDNLEDTAFGAPDPDSESEAYYDYEDRLNGPVYVKASHQRSLLRREQQRALREKGWLDFWTLSLSSCPGGPTLFRHSQAPEETPRYLFRAYDKKSHSFSDLNVVASGSERYGSGSEAGISRDITDMDPLSAANMLSAHLDWKDFDNVNGTNLVSWSSSLLFVIQYAVYRSTQQSPEDISIIAVDTTKFPPGQFAQDMFLINKYRDTFGLSDEAERFFTFRLENTRYHNGEYLSQGRLNHAGRSSTFSLQDLVNAGLYQLYPEFQDEQGRSGWANRALALREQWSSNHKTTAEEFELAGQIATRCFGPALRTRDIRILLLAFRRRKLRLHNNGSDPDDEKNRPPGPVETYRYSRLAEERLKGTRFMITGK